MAFWRSNSIPSARRFSRINGEFIDDTNIQIIIGAVHGDRPNPDEPTNPVEDTSHDAAANTRVNNESKLYIPETIPTVHVVV